jgi:hypothetical protein
MLTNGKDSYYHTLVQHLVIKENTHLRLSPEPNNAVDVNAVRVYWSDIPVGYLVREDGLSYSKFLTIVDFLTGEGRLGLVCKLSRDEFKKMPDGRRYVDIRCVLKKK